MLRSASFSHGELAEILRTCLNNKCSTSDAELKRAEAILESKTMTEWQTLPTSSILVVNGNGEDRERSLFSFLAATLVQGSIESDTPVLYFFCGENATRSGGSSPQILILSLIAQLLGYSQFDLTTIPELPTSLPEETRKLCRLFGWLIMQLPHNEALFICLDEISYFENKEHWEEICVVIESLHEIAQEAKVVVKLCLMVPSQSQSVVQVLRSGDGGKLKGDVSGVSSWGVLQALESGDGTIAGLGTIREQKRGYSDSTSRPARRADGWTVQEEEGNGWKLVGMEKPIGRAVSDTGKVALRSG
ncbi:hypothetical protein B9Z19DRAFT_1143164 [Tuber borchii]|uniref:Nephrocystin 3-like N-terminal domain-containing protein n=1 Tax=Tuber borchii TaxID=42251 RepID=A0A2T6ZRZ2_TUBBO|nr:hypothetical protein B9Z19DRAFT_1143164 [Tuber borchii]